MGQYLNFTQKGKRRKKCKEKLPKSLDPIVKMGITKAHFTREELKELLSQTGKKVLDA